MKDAIYTICGLILLTLAACMFSGCILPGFNVAEANAIAAKQQEQLGETAAKVKQLEQAVIEARDAYEEAQRSGDAEAIFAAGQVLFAKVREMELGQEDLDRVKKAAETAMQDLRDAESAADYLEFFSGTALGLLGMFGLSTPGRNRSTGALSKTAAHAKAVFGDDEDKWNEFLNLQAKGLSTGEANVLNKARGK